MLFESALKLFRGVSDNDATPREAVRSEIQRLAELERRLFCQLVERQAPVRRGAELGAQLLDGADPDAMVAQMASTQAETGLLQETLTVSHSRRMQALQSYLRLEAGEYRERAAALRREAAAVQEQTAPLLEKLSEIEGIVYDRSILLAQRRGGWEKGIGMYVDRLPLVDCAPNEVWSDPATGGYEAPRSRRLLDEAGELEAKAAELERRNLAGIGGYVTAENPAQLIDRMLADPLKPTPSLATLWTWVRGAETKIPAGNGLKREYRLQWIGEAINHATSLISCQRLGGKQGDCIEYRA
jgi:hypothetical protein